MGLPSDHNSTPTYTFKGIKNRDWNRYLFAVFMAALFTVAKSMGTVHASFQRRMGKPGTGGSHP
jgi:hypothetical protein